MSPVNDAYWKKDRYWMLDVLQREISSALKVGLFRAVLSQDIGALDTDLTTGKIIAGITNRMNVIQDTIGEKIGVVSN
ncbi:hypothetical protein Syun_001285 [Stephania yunnanensis]|uniref:ABC transmembrane type-1 domain-containing protein n=1 Tax=Stephania yunnanensis TaxID=152371 RepID=A0AAP0LEF9_9MAGN